MLNPPICDRCAQKKCTTSVSNTLDICEYGVAFYNENGKIIAKDNFVPLSMINNNLRHEIHKMLATIIASVNKLNPRLSINNIDPSDPLSRIVGTTIVIDQFIQMLVGVNEFHSTSFGSQRFAKKALAEIVNKYFNLHSIIKNKNRASDLNLFIEFDKSYYVEGFIDIYEYIFSILMDNVWKYSLPNSQIKISVIDDGDGFSDIVMINRGSIIPDGIDIFAKGVQGEKDSPGFGYGLFWARVLIDHYNSVVDDSELELELVHKQIAVEDKTAEHFFSLKNAHLSRGKHEK